MKKILFTFALLLGLSGTVCAQQYYVFRGATPSGDSLWFIYQSGSTVAAVFGGWFWNGQQWVQYSQWSNYGITGDVIIPSTVDSFNVVGIDSYAFMGCSEITSVTIPNSVTIIGDGAFAYCSGLTSVTIPNSVTSIGNDAFYFVRHIEYHGSANDDYNWGAISLNGVVENGFVYSDSDVTRHRLLAYCGTDSSVAIPTSVNTINPGAFIGYKGLLSVTIPDSVTSIPFATFANCSNLSSLTIGRGVTSIDGAAFSYCNNLTEIHSLNPVAPQLGSYTANFLYAEDADFFGMVNGQTYGAFYGVPSTVPVYIPCGSSGSYYGRWNYFSTLIEEEAFSFSAESADNNMGVVQILTMPTCTAPNAVLYASANSGYRFDHWSTGSTSNPYSLTVTTDTVITAYFVSEGGTEGIDDVNGRNIHIYTEGGNIVINGIENEKVQVFDMVGRPVGTQSLPTGVYMVKVGTLPARRVVVIR